MPPFIDLTGKRFNRLTVTNKHKTMNGRIYWKCICDCGNIKFIASCHLRSGSTVSCGCYQLDAIHKSLYKHGCSKTRLYKIWGKMKGRVLNPKDHKYSIYGGRGISMCDEWINSFESFEKWSMSNGYREDLSIDRIDVNGNYEPSNCRWIKLEEQAKNRRSNKFLTMNGVTKIASDWGKQYGIAGSLILQRIRCGWSVEDAITIPVLRDCRNYKTIMKERDFSK